MSSFQFRLKWLKSLFGALNNKLDAEKLTSFLQNKLMQVLQSDNNLILSENFKMSILIIKANWIENLCGFFSDWPIRSHIVIIMTYFNSIRSVKYFDCHSMIFKKADTLKQSFKALMTENKVIQSLMTFKIKFFTSRLRL